MHTGYRLPLMRRWQAGGGKGFQQRRFVSSHPLGVHDPLAWARSFRIWEQKIGMPIYYFAVGADTGCWQRGSSAGASTGVVRFWDFC